jgi:site-specific recombinase XerD
MRSTFKHLFYINRNKTKKNGLCPVMGRITLDSGIAQFSTGLETAPELWDAKAGQSNGKNLHELKVNRELKELSKAIETHYARMVENDGYITAERVKNAVLGIAKEPTTLLKELEEATAEIEKSVGINHSMATYRSYVNAYMNLSRFIKEKYKKEDIPFNLLEYSFIEDYDLYLKTEQRMAKGSVMQHIIFLRKMIKRAMHKGIIIRNPFFGFVPDQPVSKHKWLSSEEIERIMTARIDKPGVDFVRDMFVFGVFTGLSYSDIKNLRKEQILSDSSGNQWISLKRQKTNTESIVPLLDIPKEIIQKYEGTGEDGKVFKMLCMNVVCSYTKQIGKLCKLSDKLTFHQSRHSFATSVCLSQGVPIETLSQMMGHRNIRTTQIYAEITGAKIEEDMQLLSEKIKDDYRLAGS